MQGPTDGGIGLNFKRECKDKRTVDSVRIIKRDPRTVDLVQILKKGNAGIHGRWNRSEFLMGHAGIIGPLIWSEF